MLDIGADRPIVPHICSGWVMDAEELCRKGCEHAPQLAIVIKSICSYTITLSHEECRSGLPACLRRRSQHHATPPCRGDELTECVLNRRILCATWVNVTIIHTQLNAGPCEAAISPKSLPAAAACAASPGRACCTAGRGCKRDVPRRRAGRAGAAGISPQWGSGADAVLEPAPHLD